MNNPAQCLPVSCFPNVLDCLRRRLRAAVLGLLFLALTVPGAAAEAQLMLSCVSVRLLPATVKNLGLTYRLEATTLTDGSINDEIGPFSSEGSPYWFGTSLVYTDPVMSEVIYIWCDLDVPDTGDSNRNGVSDFNEVDLGVVGARSDGEFILDDGFDTPGTVDLTWNRAAGSTVGTCKLVLEIPDYGINLTFNHAFEILDYRGTLMYTVSSGSASIPCLVALSRLGATGSFQGTIDLIRIDQNELGFGPSGWTNEFGDVLQWYGSDETEMTLLRGARGTNYYTVLITDDGLPSTPGSYEYEIWNFHIFDGHDRDGDRVADLSDDPPSATPVRLDLRRGEQALEVRITGELGQTVTLEQCTALPATTWDSIQTLTLTNTTQTLALPPLTTDQSFWRARSP